MIMKHFSKHTPEQIVAKLDKARALKEQGLSTADICRHLGISGPTLSRWRRDYGMMSRGAAKEMMALRDENKRLKQLLADAELDKQALRELAEGNF